MSLRHQTARSRCRPLAHLRPRSRWRRFDGRRSHRAPRLSAARHVRGDVAAGSGRTCKKGAGAILRMPAQLKAGGALRAKLDVRKPALAMAAHNPLAAKLAANAGFDAIWGSGFELSASYAVPDASILPMGTHLEMMRAIGEVQDAPIIAVVRPVVE